MTKPQLLTRILSQSLLLALLAITLVPGAFANSCKSDIRRNNILANAVFTLMFRSLNGELHNWRDAGESLVWGGSAGYLFYKSRVMISRGDINQGIATAYVASSVTENTTLGKHPLARLRYGVGPVEVAWDTPWAKTQGNRFGVALNTIDALGAASLWLSGDADDFSLRNGVLTARDQGAVKDGYAAMALNRTIVTREEHNHDEGLRHHELIHTTQYLQFSSFGSTRFNLFDFGAAKAIGSDTETGMRPLSLRVEWFNSAINALDQTRDYEDRWMEIEATALAQQTSMAHGDSDICSAQLGFQMQF